MHLKTSTPDNQKKATNRSVLLLTFVMLLVAGCCATPKWVAQMSKDFHIQEESVRQQLRSKINDVSLIINISPSITTDINNNVALMENIASLKEAITEYEIPITSEIITFHPEKLTDFYRKDKYDRGLELLDLSDPSLFEKYLPQPSSSTAALVYLVDSDCTQYVSIAMALIVDGKRIDAWGAYKTGSRINEDMVFGPLILAPKHIYDYNTLSKCELFIAKGIDNLSLANLRLFLVKINH